MYSTLLHFDGLGDLLLVIVVAGILPGVAEEFVFRGVLQNELKRYLNPHLAVLLTAMVFSMIHFQFIGFFPRWYLGVMLGYLYLYSGNIYVSMAAHFFNNFMAIMAYYLFQEGHIKTSPEKLDAAVVPIPLVIASLSFAMLIGIRMWRMRNEKEIHQVKEIAE
jgi:membrane protease YdiL (CAAX protease family)